MSNQSSSSSKKTGKLIRYVKFPLRALRRARDLYERSLSGLAGRAQSRPMMASAMAARSRNRGHHHLHWPSAAASEDDLRNLIRAASQGALGPLNSAAVKAKPSRSVGRIGTIDEDRPLDLDGEDAEVGAGVVCPRSRSLAVVDKRRVEVFVDV